MTLPEKVYLELIAKTLAGEISETDRQTLREWTEASPKNRAIREEFEAIWNQAESWTPRPGISVDAAWDEFRRRADLPVPVAHTPRPMRFTRMLLRAAAAIAVLACALWWILPGSGAEAWLVAEANGQHEQVTLPDGSEIWLRKGSALSYPHSFAASSREVQLLRGEAYFEVASRLEQPFVVRTSREGERVEVLGTSFQVSASEKNTLVLVRTGRVRFSAPGMPQAIELAPGDRVAVPRDHPQAALRTRVENFNELAWRLGALEFQQTPLQQALATLSDYFEIELRLDNPALAQCPFSMRMNNPGLARVLDNLKEIYGLTATPLDTNKGYLLSGGACPK